MFFFIAWSGPLEFLVLLLFIAYFVCSSVIIMRLFLLLIFFFIIRFIVLFCVFVLCWIGPVNCLLKFYAILDGLIVSLSLNLIVLFLFLFYFLLDNFAIILNGLELLCLWSKFYAKHSFHRFVLCVYIYWLIF